MVVARRTPLRFLTDFLGWAAAAVVRDAGDFLATAAVFFFATVFFVTAFFLADGLPAVFFCVGLREATFFFAADCDTVFFFTAFFFTAFFFTAFFFAMELRLSESTPKEKEQGP